MTDTYLYQNKTIKILLVEDDDIDARSVQRGFEKSKIANPIHRAIDGVAALEMIRGENGAEQIAPPFLVLVDINMPRMNGIEFIQELRKDPELQSLIVFVLTTSPRDEDKVEAYKLNVAGYIIKENAGDDFVDLVGLMGNYWRIVELP